MVEQSTTIMAGGEVEEHDSGVHTGRLGSALAVLSLCVGLGCSTEPSSETPPSQAPSNAGPSSAGPSSAGPSSAGPSISATPTTASTPVDPVSLQALMAKSYDGRDLRLGRVLARNSAYTRHFVTYRSGALTISGVMNVPAGKGPFPVLVLNHGYIDPDIYTNGRGMMREQDYLARRGYAVLHTDYRNHAQSDDDPNAELNLRLGYTEDVINAVLAVKASGLPALDGDHVGLLGRSMGGGVTLNVLVVQPGLVDAAVVFAPVSSDTVDNFDRWIRGSPERRRLTAAIVERHGSPEAAPEFWRNVSPVTFFDRVQAPVLIHHGTSDDTCPIAWSRKTFAALQDQGKKATLLTYPGEEHAFGPDWPTSMRRTVAFFDANLRA
jgi:dipeptidyl aminopeptidase/acylaminoacyl peptidase